MKLSQKQAVNKGSRNTIRKQAPATKPGETLSQFVGRKLLKRR